MNTPKRNPSPRQLATLWGHHTPKASQIAPMFIHPRVLRADNEIAALHEPRPWFLIANAEMPA